MKLFLPKPISPIFSRVPFSEVSGATRYSSYQYLLSPITPRRKCLEEYSVR